MDQLWPVILGGVLALAGSMVAPFFSHQHERWKAQREDNQLLRAKAEELFGELDEVIKVAGVASVSAMKSVNSSQEDIVPIPDLGKIRSLTAIYFPTAIGVVKSFDDGQKTAMQGVAALAQEALAQPNGGSLSLRGIPVGMALDYQRRLADMALELRREVVLQVPSM